VGQIEGSFPRGFRSCVDFAGLAVRAEARTLHTEARTLHTEAVPFTLKPVRFTQEQGAAGYLSENFGAVGRFRKESYSRVDLLDAAYDCFEIRIIDSVRAP
jgi:hypothetical protein